MAFESPRHKFSFEAASDLSLTGQFRFVSADNARPCVKDNFIVDADKEIGRRETKHSRKLRGVACENDSGRCSRRYGVAQFEL